MQESHHKQEYNPLDDNVNLEEAPIIEQPPDLEYQQQILYKTWSGRTIVRPLLHIYGQWTKFKGIYF